MTKRLLYPTVLALLLVGFLGTGCTAPSADVRQVDLRDISLQEIGIGLTLNLHNPNQFALPIQGIDWGVSLFDIAVANGTANPEATIPAKGDTEVDVPITVRIADSTNTARRLMSASEIPWNVDGTCHFKVSAGDLSVDFSRAGHWRNPLH